MMKRTIVNTINKYYPEVTEVEDAKKNIEVEVTKRDCNGSRRKSPNHCAMARAFERTWDGAIISMGVAYLIKGTKAYRYMVPPRVSRELVSFDRHHDFAPGSYRLRAPRDSEVMRPKKAIPAQGVRKTPTKAIERRQRTVGVRSL